MNSVLNKTQLQKTNKKTKLQKKKQHELNKKERF